MVRTGGPFSVLYEHCFPILVHAKVQLHWHRWTGDKLTLGNVLNHLDRINGELSDPPHT